MFSLLRRFIEFVRSLKHEPAQDQICTLFNNATWAVDEHINLTVDILGWINDNLEELLNDGVTEVNVIIGDELAAFLLNNQKRHKYLDYSPEDVETIRNGVILVAMNAQEQIVVEHLIRSNCGLSEMAISLFKGESILKIKIPN